jgi:hypothetical protein
MVCRQRWRKQNVPWKASSSPDHVSIRFADKAASGRFFFWVLPFKRHFLPLDSSEAALPAVRTKKPVQAASQHIVS